MSHGLDRGETGLSWTDSESRLLPIDPTEMLAQAAKKVVAVEVDSRMVVELKKRFSGSEEGSRLQALI